MTRSLLPTRMRNLPRAVWVLVAGTLITRAGSFALPFLAVVALLVTQAPAAVVAVAFVTGMVSESGRPAISAMLTDLTPAARRIDAFALWRLVINLGFAVGTGVGGLLIARYGFAPLFIA